MICRCQGIVDNTNAVRIIAGVALREALEEVKTRGTPDFQVADMLSRVESQGTLIFIREYVFVGKGSMKETQMFVRRRIMSTRLRLR
jgi:hypothetical protein